MAAIDTIDTYVSAAIYSAGAVAAAVITVVFSRSRSSAKKPKNRVDTIFDGYDKLMRLQQQELDRKGAQVDQADKLVNQLQARLSETQGLIKTLRAELELNKKTIAELLKELEKIKAKFSI